MLFRSLEDIIGGQLRYRYFPVMHSELSAEMGKTGLQRVQEFSAINMVEELDLLYWELLESKGLMKPV